MEELDHRSVCRKTGVSAEAEMDVVTGVELEYGYGAGDGQTRSGVVSMPKERSGGPRLNQSCDWEKYGYDTPLSNIMTATDLLSFLFSLLTDHSMAAVNTSKMYLTFEH